MTQPFTPPQNLAFNADKVPESLKLIPRWAVWEAVWQEKKQKYTKVPHGCKPPHYGLSTAKPERWGTFAEAQQALAANPGKFAGLGLCVTNLPDLVGVDLDNCVADNKIAPWAQDVVRQLDSYVELSPSGKGLRIWCAGGVEKDWTNHEQGIEVYGGNEPRFLTVTGQRLRTSPEELSPAAPAVLTSLAGQYRREKPASATVTSIAQPDILDELVLPDLATLGISYQAREFLEDGDHRGDRSRELFTTSIALYAAGLSDAEVFSLLASSPHAMEVALDHRNHDQDRALMYLWVEQCQKAKPRATSRVASADDFEDVSPAEEQVAPGTRPKAMRFAFTPGEEFFDPAAPSTQWTIKRVLPDTGLGMVFGPSMSGKSFFVLDMAMSVARGVEWRGQKVKKGAVAYICAEGGAGFRKRGRAYLDYHGVERAGLPFHLLADAPNFLEKTDIKDLMASLRTIEGLKLVVVDTLAQTTPGANENSAEDMGRAIAHCNRIAAATGAFVLLVGHTGKDEGRGPRGWSGLPAAFDLNIQLERSGDYRAATLLKVKDGEGEGTEYPFHLNSVVLGKDDDGDDITSCVALPGRKDGLENDGQDGLSDNQRLVLQTAKDMADLGGFVRPADLRAAAREKIKKPARGKSDNRTRDIKNAYDALISMQRFADDSGFVQFPAS